MNASFCPPHRFLAADAAREDFLAVVARAKVSHVTGEEVPGCLAGPGDAEEWLKIEAQRDVAARARMLMPRQRWELPLPFVFPSLQSSSPPSHNISSGGSGGGDRDCAGDVTRGGGGGEGGCRRSRSTTAAAEDAANRQAGWAAASTFVPPGCFCDQAVAAEGAGGAGAAVHIDEDEFDDMD